MRFVRFPRFLLFFEGCHDGAWRQFYYIASIFSVASQVPNKKLVDQKIRPIHGFYGVLAVPSINHTVNSRPIALINIISFDQDLQLKNKIKNSTNKFSSGLVFQCFVESTVLALKTYNLAAPAPTHTELCHDVQYCILSSHPPLISSLIYFDRIMKLQSNLSMLHVIL